jgi:hypothetical protein
MNFDEVNYKNKYLKYKNKYLLLKDGGGWGFGDSKKTKQLLLDIAELKDLVLKCRSEYSDLHEKHYGQRPFFLALNPYDGTGNKSR